MSLLPNRRKAKVLDECPPWARRLFLEGAHPEPDTADHAASADTFLSNGVPDLWRFHRDELLAEWVKRRPGTRPPAWWKFEADEPRQQVSGKPIETGAIHGQIDDDGLPLALGYFPHGRVGFESQASYLERLGLVLPGETHNNIRV